MGRPGLSFNVANGAERHLARRYGILECVVAVCAISRFRYRTFFVENFMGKVLDKSASMTYNKSIK